MRKIICGVLVISLLNVSGCYTYSVLNEEEIENNHPTKDDAFVIVLKDGSEVEYNLEDNPQAFFVRVDEPSDFIFGSGQVYSKETKKQTKFWGKISRDMIDSTKIIQIEDGIYNIFWLKDNTRVAFKAGEYFNILPEDSTGYWIAGKRVNSTFSSKFSGKIDFADISEIQEKNVNKVVNIALIVISIGIVAFLIAAASAVGRTASAFN